MANQYANSQTMIDTLKEIYGPTIESEDDKTWRLFLNKCNKAKGLPEIEFRSINCFEDLVFSENLLLKLIPKDDDFGKYIPIPIINE